MTERDFDVTARTASHVWTATDAALGLKVVVLWDWHVIERELTPGSELVVGRAHECALRIDHKSVSRNHARLIVGEDIVVEDLGSANGTRVGSRTLSKGARVRLEPGAVVSVGVASLIVRAGGGSARPAGAITPR